MFKTTLKITLILIALSSCKGKKKFLTADDYLELGAQTYETDSLHDEKFPLYTHDSIETYNKYEAIILQNTKESTTLNNKITHHFREYVDKSLLEDAKLDTVNENIVIVFNLNRNKEPVNAYTNAPTRDLDKKLKKAFKEMDFNLIEVVEYDSRYQYTLVVIQNVKGKPSIRCNLVALGYTPPIYISCDHEFNYYNINYCNYQYITEYLYNTIDLSLIKVEDNDYNHVVNLKFILDHTGKVIAAKVQSQNKGLMHSSYNAIFKLPKAKIPAKLNGEYFYYGYNFPTTIKNIIRNNKLFKSYYQYKKPSGITLNQMMKEYLVILDRAKRRNMTFKYKMGL